MKKIYFTLTMSLAVAGVCNAQQDMSFETGGQGTNYTWNVFENDTNPAIEFVANPNAAAPNTSATVAKFTALVSGQRWAGTETNHDNGMADFVLDASHSTIKIMVYKSVISPVGIKLVTPTGAALPEKKVSNTLINQWEELTFDFSDHIGAFTDPFDQIVVFPDFTDGPRPATNIVYFDNIVFGESDIVTEPMQPMTAAPDPTLPQAQVISLFSGVYSNVPVDTFLTEWSAATMQEVEIQGNATKKYMNLSYAGTETVASQIDITDMTHFNLHVWSADFTQLRIKLVDFGANGVYDGTDNDDDEEHEVVFENPMQNEWITYNIPISDFTDLITKENIAQIIFSSNGTSTVYIDNIYFSTDSTAGVAGFTTSAIVMYPNPVTDILTIKGNDTIAEVSVYNALGQIVLKSTPNALDTQLNVSQLQSGIYVVTTKINGASSTKKFIKK